MVSANSAFSSLISSEFKWNLRGLIFAPPRPIASSRRFANGRSAIQLRFRRLCRTRFLLEDFAASFAEADETIVPDIYFVRDSEAERQKVCSADLVERIKQAGQRAQHLPDFPSIVSYLKGQAHPGDLIVTMGAGNVWEIGRDLVGERMNAEG